MSLSNEVISFKTSTKKAKKATYFSLCLKCQKSDSLSKAQLESFTKLCDAAEVHKDNVLDNIRPDRGCININDRHVVWHGDCYKLYTHKQSSEEKNICRRYCRCARRRRWTTSKEDLQRWKEEMYMEDMYLLPEGVLQKEEDINSSQNHEWSDVYYKSCKQTWCWPGRCIDGDQEW